jgi:hypothetical protein
MIKQGVKKTRRARVEDVGDALKENRGCKFPLHRNGGFLPTIKLQKNIK